MSTVGHEVYVQQKREALDSKSNVKSLKSDTRSNGTTDPYNRDLDHSSYLEGPWEQLQSC
jgi:hypothetical protein